MHDALIDHIIFDGDGAQRRLFSVWQIEVQASAYECIVEVHGHRVMRVSHLLLSRFLVFSADRTQLAAAVC